MLEAVILRPSTVYGPRSTDVVGEIARAIRGGHMLLVDRGRAIAGLCYVENLIDAAVLALRHDAAPGQAFNVTDGLDVTWKQFTDGLADGLGCSKVRWSMPYWMANGIGFSLEHGYRALRRTTHMTVPPLLSRQAVQVLGTRPGLQQPQGAGAARLGAAGRLRRGACGDGRVAALRAPVAVLSPAARAARIART